MIHVSFMGSHYIWRPFFGKIFAWPYDIAPAAAAAASPSQAVILVLEDHPGDEGGGGGDGGFAASETVSVHSSTSMELLLCVCVDFVIMVINSGQQTISLFDVSVRE